MNFSTTLSTTFRQRASTTPSTGVQKPAMARQYHSQYHPVPVHQPEGQTGTPPREYRLARPGRRGERG